MPETEVLYYCDEDGASPVIDWLIKLSRDDRRAYRKCRRAIELLEADGFELRRPTAAPLRDGISELRVRVGNVNYRLLYFFHGQGVAILAHGLTKEKAVPKVDIDRAITRKQAFESDPERHTYKETQP